MKEITLASELLKTGDKALVVYTDGRHLTDKGNGKASTGRWGINGERKFGKVIVYHRKGEDPTDNNVYIGDFDEKEGPNDEDRYTLHLVNFKLAGKTASDWRNFANTFQKEIRYLPDEKKPVWIRDELILALELYLKSPQSPPSEQSMEVRKLSAELNKLQEILGQKRSPTLRNENGVYMKMMNFRRFDPLFIAQGKKGMTHGNALEEVVWNEFGGDKERLAQTCVAIRESLKELPPLLREEENVDDTCEAPEGKLLTRLHKFRERNRKLVTKKKSWALNKFGVLKCEVCTFDFSKKYGARGQGFIECHHTKPIREYGDGGKTRIEDLALVCANCHRMVHAKKEWLTIEGLKQLLCF